MADFTNPSDSVANMAIGNQGMTMGTTGGMHDTDFATDDLWGQHDAHFREQYASRPYARADRAYESYQPAYRYGYDAARQQPAREWHEAEGELAQGWDWARGATGHAWHEVKDAARDAWDRVRGR